ncbi:MAG: cyclic pyranopterin monophosphate synthase MoaC [Leadbetterella sp.]
MDKFTHLDANGNPSMVDVSEKSATKRIAVARSIVVLTPEIMALLKEGELVMQKGPVFQTAIIAGIMAAKNTGNLIPLCHPIGMEDCQIHIEAKPNNEVHIVCQATVTAKTGIEMEAIVGASIAAITIYDMCKALSHTITIKETRLLKKTGGKNDFELLES